MAIIKDQSGLAYNSSNRLYIDGQVAPDAATAGNVITVGGKTLNTTPANMSASGDAVFTQMTMSGQIVNKPYSVPEADWQFAVPSPKVDTTDSVAKAAGAAGIRNYVTGIQMINTNATATELVVKDGAAVIWRGFLQANMTSSDTIQFHTPLKGTAATALNVACITTGANVYVNVQGYQAP